MGRPEDSGAKSGIKPHLQSGTAMRAQLHHGHPDWKMILLRERIRVLQREEEKRLGAHFDPERTPLLPDNFLSARALDNAKVARQNRYLMREEIDALWCDLVAGFERAVIYGDAEWFQRQARAIRSRDTRTATARARDQFEAAVVARLEASALLLCGEEDSTPTPARLSKRDGKIILKRTGDTPDEILDRFETREAKLGETVRSTEGARQTIKQNPDATSFRRFYVLVAPGVEVRFESRARAREEITKLAAKCGYKLKRKVTRKLKRK